MKTIWLTPQESPRYNSYSTAIGNFLPRARSSMDRALDFGSKGWGFDSLRARQPPRSTIYDLSSRTILFFARPAD